MMIRTTCAFLLLCLMVPPVVAQSSQTVSLDDVSGAPGTSVSTSVRLSAQVGMIGGWTIGVCHDATKLTLDDVIEGSVFSILGEPAFFSTIEDTALSGQGWYASGILDPLDPLFPGGLPAASDYELYECTYTIVGAGPDATALDFCSTLGSPPVANVVVVELSSVTPDTVNGVVSIDSPDFRRSDCDASGVIDITDVVVSLYYVLGLLEPAETPTCLAACDSNGDAGVDLTDVAFLLDHLFQNGPLLAPVGCGADPSPSVASCVSFAACP